jgi:hypothetical protein
MVINFVVRGEKRGNTCVVESSSEEDFIKKRPAAFSSQKILQKNSVQMYKPYLWTKIPWQC